jgi:hypothetical protein
MATSARPIHHLELRVRELGQLFNSMDPTPFLNKDLDREAEAFIESWAVGFPTSSRLHITVHLKEMPPGGDPTALVTESIHNYFVHKSGLMRRDLQRLLKRGRTSLLIGLAFVAVCLLGAEAIGKGPGSAVLMVARESLLIVGWVAMWRPLEIFLYDWWPLARWIRVYHNLSQAHVRVVQGK